MRQYYCQAQSERLEAARIMHKQLLMLHICHANFWKPRANPTTKYERTAANQEQI